MNISDKVRKDLWAKSGNRCAICHKELFSCIDKDDFNIGEECHIVSSQPNGPRHIDNYGDYDSFDNIILLCRNHHKEIDDPANINLYSVDKLIEIKKQHEKWVSQHLESSNLCALENLINEVEIIKGKNPIVFSVIRKSETLLSDLFGQEDSLITELSSIDFSEHLDVLGKIDNALHLKISGYEDGKKELLRVLTFARERLIQKNACTKI